MLLSKDYNIQFVQSQVLIFLIFFKPFVNGRETPPADGQTVTGFYLSFTLFILYLIL